jgi:hypothetical protein
MQNPPQWVSQPRKEFDKPPDDLDFTKKPEDPNENIIERLAWVEESLQRLHTELGTQLGTKLDTSLAKLETKLFDQLNKLEDLMKPYGEA